MKKILQVCPSWGTACGVANFSYNLSQHINRYFNIQNSANFIKTDADIILIEHEFGLFNTKKLKRSLEKYKQRKVLFCHTAVDDTFDNHVDAYISMAPNMQFTLKPSCLFPHPGYYEEYNKRNVIRKQLGFDKYKCILGTNGFISPSRDFVEIATVLALLGKKYNWGINLAISKHAKHNDNFGYIEIEQKLKKLASNCDNVFLNRKFLTHSQLYRKLQASDLLWCWSSSYGNYASGTASDQYCSGTRQVVVDKVQHHAVLNLPNVVKSADCFENFIETLVNEARKNSYPRHDGKILSWENSINKLVGFLCQI